MKEKYNSCELQRIDSLYDKITTLIEQARKSIVKNVNSIETYCKFETGKYIIEDELEGKYRASYGKKVLILLSEKLTKPAIPHIYIFLSDLKSFYILCF